MCSSLVVDAVTEGDERESEGTAKRSSVFRGHTHTHTQPSYRVGAGAVGDVPARAYTNTMTAATIKLTAVT